MAFRAHAEAYARDSLANLVFSIALFFSVTGGYPRNVILTGFDIKAARFRRYAAALGLRPEHFTNIAVNYPPPHAILKRALAGERKNSTRWPIIPSSEARRIARSAESALRSDTRYGTEFDTFIDFLYDDLYAPDQTLKALLTKE